MFETSLRIPVFNDKIIWKNVFDLIEEWHHFLIDNDLKSFVWIRLESINDNCYESTR